MMRRRLALPRLDTIKLVSWSGEAPEKPLSENPCRFNRSMQHPGTHRSDSPSNRESVRTIGLNKNLNRAFDLFGLMPTQEISFPGSFKEPSSKCCIDPLRPPHLSGLSDPIGFWTWKCKLATCGR